MQGQPGREHGRVVVHVCVRVQYRPGDKMKKKRCSPRRVQAPGGRPGHGGQNESDRTTCWPGPQDITLPQAGAPRQSIQHLPFVIIRLRPRTSL